MASLSTAHDVIDVIRKSIYDTIKDGALVDLQYGVVVSSSGYEVSAYLSGDTDTASDYIRLLSGQAVSAGDYVVVAIDKDNDKWVDQILPRNLFSKLSVDHETGSLYVGDGTVRSGSGSLYLKDSAGNNIVELVNNEGTTTQIIARGTSSAQVRAHGHGASGIPFLVLYRNGSSSFSGNSIVPAGSLGIIDWRATDGFTTMSPAQIAVTTDGTPAIGDIPAKIRFYIGGTERMAITPQDIEVMQPIKFPSSPVLSSNANTLDDYRENTFTPTISFATPGTLAVVYSQQSGTYTKQGNRVFFDLIIQTSTFTLGTAAGNFFIDGLPFNTNAQCTCTLSINYTHANFTQVVGFLPNADNIIRAWGSSNAGVASNNLTAAELPTATNLLILASGHYGTAE